MIPPFFPIPVPSGSSRATNPVSRASAVRGLVLALASVFPFLSSGEEPPGPSNHLFRAFLPEAGTLVSFLPLEEIASPEDAGAWSSWSESAHADGAWNIVFRWDVDDIAVAERENGNLSMRLSGFLWPGAPAVDPSGTNRFEVTAVPGPDGGSFRIGLAGRPVPPGTATPHLCLSNVWVVSREALFGHWEDLLESGLTNEVRSLVSSFRESGRFKLSGGASWRGAVDGFVADHPELRGVAKIANGTGRRIRVRIDGGDPSDLAAGDELPIPAGDGDAARIRWEARDADEPSLVDEDYEWDAGELMWSPGSFRDAVTNLVARPGRRKDDPRCVLPADAVPEELRETISIVRSSVHYADGETIEARLEESKDGTLSVAVVPHRAIERIRLSGEGWKDGDYRPVRKANGLFCGDDLLLSGEPMERIPEPAAVEVEKMTAPVLAAEMSEHEVDDVLPVDRRTVSPAESIERNTSYSHDDSSALKALPPWVDIACFRQSMNFGDLSNPNNRWKAAMSGGSAANQNYTRILSDWQGFWPVEQYVQQGNTIREAVAHICTCPTGCNDCREDRKRSINNKWSPKEEAFFVLCDWDPQKQRKFCEVVADNIAPPTKTDVVKWNNMLGAFERGNKTLDEVRDFWENGIDKSEMKPFRACYRKAELSSADDHDWGEYQQAIAGKPTFEDRLVAFFETAMKKTRPDLEPDKRKHYVDLLRTTLKAPENRQ